MPDLHNTEKILASRVLSSGFLDGCPRQAAVAPTVLLGGACTGRCRLAPAVGSLPGTRGQEGDVVVAKDAPGCEAGQCRVPVDGLPGTSAPGVMDARDTVPAGSLREILPGHGRVGLHLGRTAQICRFPMDLGVFWFAWYSPEPRDLGFP